MNDIESLRTECASTEDLRPEIYSKTENVSSKGEVKRNYQKSMIMYSFVHSFMTLAFSIICFLNPLSTRFDPMVTLFGISFILTINLVVFADFFGILRMKAGRDSEMNKIKIEILKISLIDEIIDLKTVTIAQE